MKQLRLVQNGLDLQSAGVLAFGWMVAIVVTTLT
jgi:hypothetical protein